MFGHVEENLCRGGTIHENLEWANHINKIYSKVIYFLGFIQQI